VAVSVRQLATWMGLFGLSTVGLLVIGAGPIAELFALFHLVAFAGAPLASLLRQDLRSRTLVVGLAMALSLALGALAAQSLAWFDLARPELIVLVTTAYGFVLAWLLSSTAVSRGRVLQSLERGGQT